MKKIMLIVPMGLLICSIAFCGAYDEISLGMHPKDSVLESSDGSDIMAVNEVLSMEGRGIVVQGTVAHGSFKINDKVFIHSQTGRMLNFRIRGIELDRTLVDKAKEGETVGFLL